MVLKYKTVCIYTDPGTKKETAIDKWHFVDGIIGASVYYDESAGSVVVDLEFESRPPMGIAVHDTAYLLNENGKTIEKVRC